MPVNLHIYLRGTHRIIQDLTDANGNFATRFTPLPNEAGTYQIGAAHPGDADAPVQATFNLLGMQLAPLTSSVLVREGGTTTGTVSVVNLGSLPLTGLAASIVSQPPNLNVNLQLGGTTVSGDGTVLLTYRVAARDLSQPQGQVEFQLTSAQGVLAQGTLLVGLVPLRPVLVVTPTPLYAAMPLGGQQRVQFQVINAGGVTSGPVNLSLPSVPWLSVAGANPLPPLGPGETNVVTLLLTPAVDLPLGPYSGTLSVSTTDSASTVPFTFLALSEALARCGWKRRMNSRSTRTARRR